MAALTVKNLRLLAMRASSRLSIYSDNVLSWLAGDYILQSKFYYWMVAKGGWRQRFVESGPMRWLLYGMNDGAGTVATTGGKFLGFWPYMRSAVTNSGKDRKSTRLNSSH